MKLKPKMQDPLVFKLKDGIYTILVNSEVGIIELPISDGTLIRGHHYGFIIMIEKPNDRIEIEYPTQMEITSARGDDLGFLHIREKHKHPSSWLFNHQGKMMLSAKFNYEWGPARKFLYKLGVDSPKAVRLLNKEAKPKKKSLIKGY